MEGHVVCNIANGVSQGKQRGLNGVANSFDLRVGAVGAALVQLGNLRDAFARLAAGEKLLPVEKSRDPDVIRV